jgi:CBS-domain-containing membrane protein
MDNTPSPLIVGTWMKTSVHVAHPHDSIEHAREVCERHGVKLSAVVAGGRRGGVVTDRDSGTPSRPSRRKPPTPTAPIGPPRCCASRTS